MAIPVIQRDMLERYKYEAMAQFGFVGGNFDTNN
jgi:hypothetical protein